jgi:fermentation-respiration switch protein FrsA (DUF1100 family)
MEILRNLFKVLKMSITGTTLGFATQFKKYPNVDLSHKFFGASSQSTTQTPTVKLNYYFLKGLDYSNRGNASTK